jgi:hypothetical protein
MRLVDPSGRSLELHIEGYQYLDAEDPAQRFSWHMVGGIVVTESRSWPIRFPALTCDESGRISAWLRCVADAIGAQEFPLPLTFTEPNLAFEADPVDTDLVRIRVALDAELSAEKPPRFPGHPYSYASMSLQKS